MTVPLPFTKMHGLGNHYVFVEALTRTVDEPAALARAVSDPSTGVGADGLILILPSSPAVARAAGAGPDAGADVRMRIFNADGSEAEMCGNGIRCVCKYVHDHGISTARPMRIETGAGVLSLDYETGGDGRVDTVTVDMGEPIVDPARLRIEPALLAASGGVHHAIDLPGGPLEVVLVSMGNPHVVAFTDRVDDVPLAELGPAIECHPAFPERTNAHFVELCSAGAVRVRTWERGSGATMACGTGAAAVCVAGVVSGRTRRSIVTHLPGGDLRVDWRESTGHVLTSGPAREVFRGEWTGA